MEEKIKEDLLEYCANDYMGLWVIPWTISDSLSSGDRLEEIKRKSMDIIREMMQRGWIEIGQFVKVGDEYEFSSLERTVDEAIELITKEWDQLGRMPSLGEICWFRATPAGRKRAEELGLLGGQW